jgi:hypothetical protein
VDNPPAGATDLAADVDFDRLVDFAAEAGDMDLADVDLAEIDFAAEVDLAAGALVDLVAGVWAIRAIGIRYNMRRISSG